MYLQTEELGMSVVPRACGRARRAERGVDGLEAERSALRGHQAQADEGGGHALPLPFGGLHRPSEVCTA